MGSAGSAARDFGPGVPADWYGNARVPVTAEEAFNGYVAAQVIFALTSLGLIDALLEPGDPISLRAFLAVSGAEPQVTGALIKAAVAFGYIARRGDVLALTEPGREIAAMRGYFQWAVGGYGDVFGRAASIASGASSYGDDVRRDEVMVARGSAQNDASFMSRILDDALQDLEVETLVDLGSGTSARLCRVVAGRPGTRGIGVDLSEGATREAQHSIGLAGLSDRVDACQADVFDILLGRVSPRGSGDADAVMSFFLLHDLFADPSTRAEILPRLRDAFPRARTFILADTVVRPDADVAVTLPMFAEGFELAHALMGVPLHTKEAYEEMFASAGLQVDQAIPFGTPHSWLYLLTAR